VHDLGQRQQLGTHVEAGSLNRVHVNGEAHPVIFKIKLNAAPAFRKIPTFSNCERAYSGQRIDDIWQALFLFVADEDKLTVFQIRKIIRSAQQDCAAIDVFSPNDVIQRAAEWIVAKDADRERTCFISKNVRGPFDKFRKVQKKRRFKFVLGGTPGLCRSSSGTGWREPKGQKHQYGYPHQAQMYSPPVAPSSATLKPRLKCETELARRQNCQRNWAYTLRLIRVVAALPVESTYSS
jgi:hypothetical protein